MVDVQVARGGRDCCLDGSCGILGYRLVKDERHAPAALDLVEIPVVSRLH